MLIMHLFVNIAINAAVPELDYLAICGLTLSKTFDVYAMQLRERAFQAKRFTV